MAESSPQDGPLAMLRSAAERNPSTKRLFSEVEDYLGVQAHSMVSAVGDKLDNLTSRLTHLVEGGSKPDSGETEATSSARTAKEVGVKGLKDKVKGVVQSRTGSDGSSGSSGKESSGKFNNIVEDCDVGVPVHVAYNQWTQYQDYSHFTRGVLSVDNIDEMTSNWKVKVAKSKRSLKATVTEQIPDERIAWTTEGAKGTIRGVVTFHSLGANLTRVLLVIEYYPAGFFERTANMWWAASRRVRLDLKHYRRFVMMGGAETGAWRGEIRDGEVVRSHEEVLEQEEREGNEARGRAEAGPRAEDEDYGAARGEREDAGTDSDEYPEPPSPRERPSAERRYRTRSS